MEAEDLKIKMLEMAFNCVEPLVDREDLVTIKATLTSSYIVVTISLDKSDIGKVIGKSGRTIQAIRTLLGSVANRYRFRCHVEVEE